MLLCNYVIFSTPEKIHSCILLLHSFQNVTTLLAFKPMETFCLFWNLIKRDYSRYTSVSHFFCWTFSLSLSLSTYTHTTHTHTCTEMVVIHLRTKPLGYKNYAVLHLVYNAQLFSVVVWIIVPPVGSSGYSKSSPSALLALLISAIFYEFILASHCIFNLDFPNYC